MTRGSGDGAAAPLGAGPRPDLGVLVLRRLAELMPAERARAVLHEALVAEHLEAVPRDAWGLRAFVEGPLARSAGGRLTGFEPLFDEAARAGLPGSNDEPSQAARVFVLSVDPAMLDAIRARVGADSVVTRADSVYGLSPMAEIGSRSRSVLVVDVPLSPVPLSTLARMDQLIARNCSVWLLGVRPEDHRRVAGLFTRFDRMVACASLDDLHLRDPPRTILRSG